VNGLEEARECGGTTIHVVDYTVSARAGWTPHDARTAECVPSWNARFGRRSIAGARVTATLRESPTRERLV
jgi:hypothetical protein